MAVDAIGQVLLVVVTVIISLIISYSFFDNSFNYMLYFELIFLTLFISFNVIEYYYLSVVILVLAILIFRAIEPELKGENQN